ncbi:hypothetical protein NW768_008580 [Fusarium equiseti]|uniref:NACHT domain-containing protein n=1 Tax=Fusarium equiseti TaxID=61235 RepID=A0ABQ8R579_FUSEQ|nr:hypothetical protein NW768_008580 [Fusarium equiseti]
MSGKRSCNEDRAATSSSRPYKKVQHGTRKTLSHDSYTIAWICALPLEMSAARAMLDYVHDALPQHANDSNCYELGTIRQHNVAIACLPDGHYGTNNAAIVFTNMRRSFNNIQLGLMVGIGGGAPGRVDLRLGDIVVGSKVVQHDMGKAMSDGQFNRTSIPRPVPSSASTVISSLRSKHHSSPSRVPSILRERSEALLGFERPVSADRLFAATYQHESSIPDCASCDQSKLVQRVPRDSNDPVIHYGAIASGNQVIKDSLTRDNLTRELDVICFEMEAAGLMDICPCLPVRGICDYSDSHKAKEWQMYAAATAAAYAREFLEELAVFKVVSDHQQQLQIYLDEKDKECLRDLRITNPEDDKETIIKAKGGLLFESYRWVMENEGYQRWGKDNENRLLWIKGDPGKGKTMLLCGIIDELEIYTAPDSVFYFFCQASEPRLRSASAVLRGLIWFLARRRANLISHIRKVYDQGGKDVFNDHNALQALSNIMTSMLDDDTADDCVFVIDALDECSDDRERLIELVTQFSSTSKSRWIVSSRNWPEIEAQLDGVATNRVNLELNHSSIAEAVRRFITRRVDDLTRKKRYTESTREAVLEHLLTNANDTFLWVSLVCEELGKFNVLPHHTLKILDSFPAGLNDLYQRMIKTIMHSRDEQICKAILAVVAVAFEPLSLAELATADERLTPFSSDLETLSTIATCCGSFLTIRNNIVYMVHQSVKDYLVTSSDIFPSGTEEQHWSIFQSTMERICVTFHRNMYNVPDDTLYLHEILKSPSSPLDSMRYGCIYWIDHLHESTLEAIRSLTTSSLVEAFLKSKYLYWLEAMSLLGCVSTAITAIRKLESGLSEKEAPELKDLAEDALRFVLTHRAICDTVPLQLYDSALIFSPEQSQVRQNFICEISRSLSPCPSSYQQWDARLFNISNVAEFHSQLKVSHVGRRLAITQSDKSILILDSFTGETFGRIRGSQPCLSIVGFDTEGKYLATTNGNGSKVQSVMIWNTHTGECIRSSETRADFVVLSQDMLSLVLAERSGSVHVCDPWDGTGKYTTDLLYGKGRIEWIDFGLTKCGTPCILSITSTGDRDSTPRGVRPEVVVQNPQTGQVIARASLASNWYNSYAALNPDGKRLLIAQQEKLQLWDGDMLTHLRDPSGHEDFHSCFGIAWATDGRSFAMSTRDAVILYDVAKQAQIGRVSLEHGYGTRLCYVSTTDLAVLGSRSLQMLRVKSRSKEDTFAFEQASRPIHQLNPGPNGQLELSKHHADNEIIVADPDSKLSRFHVSGSRFSVWGAVFSSDYHYAFVDGTGMINIWDTKSCRCLHKLRGHASDTKSSKIVLEFDLSGQLVSANHHDAGIRIWNPKTGNCLRMFKSRHWPSGIKMATSTDGRIAIMPKNGTALYTWGPGRADGGKTEWTMPTNPLCLSLSSNGLLAVLWEVRLEGTCLCILDVSLGTSIVTDILPWWTQYARFDTGSNSRIHLNHGILDLDLDRVTGAEEVAEEVAEERNFNVQIRDKQRLVWNTEFPRFVFTTTEAWLMRGFSLETLYPTFGKPNNTMSKKAAPSFPGFEALSQRIFVRHAESSQPIPGHPHAIVVFGWGDAPPKHVSKFTDGYRKLFPNAKQIAVLSPIGQGFFDHVSKRTEDMKPIVNELFPNGKDHSNTLILCHVLSNSGAGNYICTLNAYRELYNAPMPHVLAVYDSTPGQSKVTWSNLKRWSNAMAMGPASKLPWPFFITQTLCIGFFIFIHLFDFVVGRESSPKFCHRLFFDDKWMSKDSTRLFMYGKQDILIPAEHIEEHIAEGLRCGYKTESQIFESGHVDHMRRDPERYWRTIDEAWKRAVSSS